MRAVTKCMSNFTGNVSCAVSDSARTISKSVPDRCRCFLDPVTDCLGSLFGFVNGVDFA